MPDEMKPGADPATGKAEAPAIVPKEPPKVETDAKAPSRDDVIDRWFGDHFAGTALGATTELYNAAYAAKEDLKTRLAR